MIPQKRIFMSLLCSVALLGSLQSGEGIAGSEQSPAILGKLRESRTVKVLIAAHRGGYENDLADEAPENSVANIRNSQEKRYELFETDIQRTKDGHFVIVHDPTIDRETSGSGKVSEMTLDEVRSLRKRYRDRSLSQERVATLEEFLIEGKGRTVYKADLKPGVNEYFGAILKLLAKCDAQAGVIFRVPYRDANLFERFNREWGPVPKHTWMFRVTSKEQVDDIKKRFDSSTISIVSDRADPSSEKTLELIRYSRDSGFVVEAHAEGNEEDWRKLIDAGVSILHARAPSGVRKFLDSLQSVE